MNRMMYDRVQMSQAQCDNFIAKLCNEFHTLWNYKCTTLGNCDERCNVQCINRVPAQGHGALLFLYSHFRMTLFGLM